MHNLAPPITGAIISFLLLLMSAPSNTEADITEEFQSTRKAIYYSIIVIMVAAFFFGR